MTLMAEKKRKNYETLLSLLTYTADNLTVCQENISALMEDAHETETADGLLIMTDVLQALNLALAWTDGAADRVSVLRKLFEGVNPEALGGEPDEGVYLECMNCGVFQPVAGGFSPGDTCPVCDDGVLEDPIPF